MDWLIKDISAELKSWGHQGGSGGKTIFKTGGEPAIQRLAEAVAKYHGRTVIPETPPKGYSQSNGTAEEAGNTVREFTRVVRIQFEDKAQTKIHCEGVITVWMIRWAAMLCSRYLVGKDGQTGTKGDEDANVMTTLQYLGK